MSALVIGAGGIGQHVARRFVGAGIEVTLASRSGRPPAPWALDAGEIRAASVEASDADALTRLAAGHDVMVIATNPPYTQWRELWPPVARASIAAAEASGARLIMIGNLYPLGTPGAVLTESSPDAPNGSKGQVRADVWRQILDAHRAGRVRAVEVRASDYFGPGAIAGMSYLNQYAILPAMKGRVARHIMGKVDAPHSWTFLPDIAQVVVALALTEGDRAWGRTWITPTASARSLRDIAEAVATLEGIRPRTPKPYPAALKALLRLSPFIRELDEMAPAFERPYLVDSSDAQRAFGLVPTPFADALRQTIAWLKTS